jgi:mRNA deadenylase 3'-5' endonuclease subunit Ccr4
MSHNIRSKMPKENQLCVITYNLLSPWYVKPTYFPGIEKQYLDDESRLKRTFRLLEKWVNAKAVICLQELCDQWARHLERFFEENNYVFCKCTYAKGKSGVSVSFPKELFEHVVTYTDSCFDEKQFDALKKFTKNPQILEELANATVPENKYVGSIVNVKSTGKKLLLATYHMPCKPQQKYFLASHVLGLKESLFNISKMHHCDHVVLSGDFNITSNSQIYKFLVGIGHEDLDFIKELKELYEKNGQSIDPINGIEFQSSHLKINGSEPVYTNVSAMNDGGLFVECLDYCFTTKSIILTECAVDLMVENPSASSYPNESCPSDHQPLITKMLI